MVDVENDGEYYWNRRDNSTCCRLPRGVKHRWCLLPSVRTPVVTQRQVPTEHSFILPVQLLDKVLDMPVVVLRQVLRFVVQKAVVVPQLQSIEGRRHSFRSAEADPMVQTIQETTEILQLLFDFRWLMPLLCGSCSFSCAAR